MSEEEIKQLKLERDTAIFVAKERLDEIEKIKNQKEIFELRYLKEERENDKLHSIIKEVRELVENGTDFKCITFRKVDEDTWKLILASHIKEDFLEILDKE